MDIQQDYLTVDQIKNRKNQDISELKECDGKLIIKQYSGINTNNFIIKKYDGKKIQFAFFKLNGIYYININGEHIFDYRKFIKIQQISKIDNDIKVKNTFIGDFTIQNCDPEIFKKSLDIMNTYMKNHKSYLSELVYFLFN